MPGICKKLRRASIVIARARSARSNLDLKTGIASAKKRPRNDIRWSFSSYSAAVFLLCAIFIFVTVCPAGAQPAPAQAPAPAQPPAKTAQAAPPEGDVLKQVVTLDYKDTDLATILRSLSYTYGLNLVTSTEVKGKITVSLQNVTLAEALEVVLGTNGYNYTRKGNIIYITPGASEGAQLISEAITLNYLKAGDAQNLLRKVLSPKGDIKVDEVFNLLVVTDYQANVEKLKALLASVDHPPQQVLIEAKIVDITTKDLQNLGVTWQVDYSPSQGLWGRQTQYPEQIKGTGTFAGPSQSLTSGQFKLDAFILKGLSASATIDALIQDQKANLLASPSIAVLNNREARIIIGEKVPYKERTQTTTGTTETTKFVDVGTTLRVTPSINSDGYITMTIHPEVSSVNALLDAGPLITTREADTMVRVKEGETVIIGGLISRQDNRTTSRTPILGYIPLLGYLFSDRSKDASQTELTVFITPKILRSREEIYKEGRSRYQEEAFVNILSAGKLNLQRELFDKARNLEHDSGLDSRRKEEWQSKHQALNMYENILSQFPDGPIAAESAYRAANIYYTYLKDLYRARELCAVIISAYPNDTYAARAREMYKSITFDLEKKRLRQVESDRAELLGRRGVGPKLPPGLKVEVTAERPPTQEELRAEAEREAAEEEAKRRAGQAAAAKKIEDEKLRRALELEKLKREAEGTERESDRKAREEELRRIKAEADAAKRAAEEEARRKSQLRRIDEKIAQEQARLRAIEEHKRKSKAGQEARQRERLKAEEEQRAKEEAASAEKAKEEEARGARRRIEELAALVKKRAKDEQYRREREALALNAELDRRDAKRQELLEAALNDAENWY